MSRPKRFCTVDDCGRPRFGHGYCQMHYQRWRKHGDVLAEDHRQYATGRPANKPEDVWRFVQRGPDDECWPWLGARRRRGYGAFTLGRRSYVATRVIYQLVHGVDPGELFVCHHCDNPPCCNPAHLFLGTERDNVHDMLRKGRARPANGSRHHGAKLTERQVLEVRARRASGEKLVDLASEFGVSDSWLSTIVRHPDRAWRHVA